MVQKSKVDWWLYLLAWAGPVVVTVMGLHLWLAANNPKEGQTLFLIGLFAIALIVAFTTPMRYRIEEGEISVRFGLFRVRVPVDEVVEVIPSFSLWSAPAWSLDRMKILFERNGKRRTLLISPEDKQAFMNHLVEVDEGLEWDGDGVKRGGRGEW
ncbi:MAG: PH domain-containing protein [Planctomycetota bacterium]|jgi:hypothetical protein|nr:PH domain-containing protein [Planctomycetota bacterium]